MNIELARAPFLGCAVINCGLLLRRFLLRAAV